jgi:hypothetical protein
VRLEQLGRRGRFVVELRDVTVPFRIVVVGIDHNLPRQRLDGHGSIILQRNRDNDNVAGLCCFEHRHGTGPWSELGDEILQRLRATGIADGDVVALCYGEARDLAADVSGADESNGLHGINVTPRQAPSPLRN